jgi:hypothetical protein
VDDSLLLSLDAVVSGDVYETLAADEVREYPGRGVGSRIPQRERAS